MNHSVAKTELVCTSSSIRQHLAQILQIKGSLQDTTNKDPMSPVITTIISITIVTIITIIINVEVKTDIKATTYLVMKQSQVITDASI